MGRVPPGETRRCIYCLETKAYTGNAETGCLFSAEHVINKAFVRGFAGQGQTLIDRVCHDCNQSFKDDQIDDEITRKGPEGLLRLVAGQKKKEKLFEFERNNNVTSFSAHSPGTIDNKAVVTVVHRNGRIEKDYPAQILYLEPDAEEPGQMSIDAFIGGDWKKLTKPGTLVKFIGEDKEQLQRLNSFMVANKIGFELESESTEPFTVEVALEIQMTDLYKRALAKTAFNYLAFVTRVNFPSHVFEERFNTIRRFIRYGERPTQDPVVLRHPPEPGILDRTSGLKHRLKLYPGICQGEHLLLCNVQINSHAVWQVYLAYGYVELDSLVGCSHVWDCDTKQVSEESNEAKKYARQVKSFSLVSDGPSPIIRPTGAEVMAICWYPPKFE